jgi:hypothetical protein
VAFVTGAGHGIGRATALRLGSEGAAVVCFDLKGETAEGTASASTATLCYSFMFLVLPILRRKYSDTPRPYRVPGGTVGCWICAVLSELFVIVTGLTLLWPGLIDSWFGQDFNLQDYLGLSVSRTFFEVATLGTFGAMILLAVVFWAVGRRNLRTGLAGGADELVVSLSDLDVAPPRGGGARM